MRITLNLATRPYVELRPIYQRLRIAMLVLIVLGIGMVLLLRVEQRRAAASLARVNQVHQNIARLEAQQASYQALMQQPQNAAVLTQSEFLNQMFARKAFSWTATMTELERTLPGGVQVVSIDPVVAVDGHVTVRLRVTGPRERAVLVVANLEHSRHFLAPRLASESLANATGSGTAATLPVGAATDVSFDILADYKPLPHLNDAAASPDSAADAAGTTGRPARKQAQPLPADAPVLTRAPRNSAAAANVVRGPR